MGEWHYNIHWYSRTLLSCLFITGGYMFVTGDKISDTPIGGLLAIWLGMPQHTVVFLRLCGLWQVVSVLAMWKMLGQRAYEVSSWGMVVYLSILIFAHILEKDSLSLYAMPVCLLPVAIFRAVFPETAEHDNVNHMRDDAREHARANAAAGRHQRMDAFTFFSARNIEDRRQLVNDEEDRNDGIRTEECRMAKEASKKKN